MGCCFGKDDEDVYQDDAEQREALINPVSGQDGPSQPITNYNTYRAPSEQKGGDEQSALNRILHQTANDMVDAAAIDTQMEHNEYMDRARQYSLRLSSAFSNSHKLRSTFAMPMGVAAPQVVLASQPVSLADIQFITTAAQQTSKAVNEIKVKHKEDLVVPFGVP